MQWNEAVVGVFYLTPRKGIFLYKGIIMKNDKHAVKVITWRILSIVICTLIGRIWFGDWHVTVFGLFLSLVMTFVHYIFEIVWSWQK